MFHDGISGRGIYGEYPTEQQGISNIQVNGNVNGNANMNGPMPFGAFDNADRNSA
jgi:hypothetical protein